MRLITFIFILTFLKTNSQQYADVGIGFQYTHPGFSWSIDGEYEVKRFGIGAALKIIQFRHPQIENNQVFRNKLVPLYTGEYFGFGLNTKFYILKNRNFIIQPFINYNFIFTRSSLWLYGVSPEGIVVDPITGEEKQIYTFLDIRTHPPMIMLENFINIGADVRIYKGLYFTQKAGLGIALMYNIPAILPQGKKGEWEFAWMYQVGLKYKFKLKNKAIHK